MTYNLFILNLFARYLKKGKTNTKMANNNPAIDFQSDSESTIQLDFAFQEHSYIIEEKLTMFQVKENTPLEAVYSSENYQLASVNFVFPSNEVIGYPKVV